MWLDRRRASEKCRRRKRQRQTAAELEKESRGRATSRRAKARKREERERKYGKRPSQVRFGQAGKRKESVGKSSGWRNTTTKRKFSFYSHANLFLFQQYRSIK